MGMSDVHSAVTLELPKTNRFWSDERLKKFLTDHDMQKFADCAACAMGLVTSQNQPIGKVFRIACTDQVLATGLERRFQCKCTQDLAPLNQVNYSMTERYSYKFARFYCRAIALRWIDQQEETSWFCLSLQFAFHVSSLTPGKHSFPFELNRSVEFACLHGSQRIQGHSFLRHSLQWRFH